MSTTTTNKAQHTPTPWTIEVNKNDEGKGIPPIDLVDIQEERFCTMLYKPGVYHPDGIAGFRKEHLANAAHIVHCVNLHDELVAALKTFVNHIQNRPHEQPRLEYIQELRNLIAKAEAQP